MVTFNGIETYDKLFATFLKQDKVDTLVRRLKKGLVKLRLRRVGDVHGFFSAVNWYIKAVLALQCVVGWPVKEQDWQVMATLNSSRLEVKSDSVLQGGLSQSTSVEKIKNDLYNLFSEIKLKKTSVLPHGFFPEFTNNIKYKKLVDEIRAGKDPVSLSDDSRAKKRALRRVQAKRKDDSMSNADKDSEEEEEAEAAPDEAAKKRNKKNKGKHGKRNKKTQFGKDTKGGK